MNVYLETYGCQMNEYDSELVRSILQTAGHHFTSSFEEAEVVLMNTCAIRENAHRKIYNRLDQFRPVKKAMKKAGRPFVVGVLGCMAQNLKEDLFAHPVVSLIVGPDSYRALPKLIDEAARSGSRDMAAYLSEYETYEEIVPTRVEGVNAWVAIMRGCDNFCTFCVVPYTRGRERSRSMAGIVAEVEALSEAGCPQVTLLGQNVNSYHDGETTFAELITRVAEVPAIRRVRFTSPHPKDFPRPLLKAIGAHPHICKHIHLPLQAGSDRVLSLMGRTYSLKEYLALVDEIYACIPNVALTTDIIVGFPTETDADFQETARVLSQIEFESAYIFKYSERKGTIAAREYPDDVPPEVKTDRIVRLLDLQHEISLRKNRARMGQRFSVLIEGACDKRLGHQFGKTDGHTTVIFPETGHSKGTFVSVEILDATPGTLFGRCVEG